MTHNEAKEAAYTAVNIRLLTSRFIRGGTDCEERSSAMLFQLACILNEVALIHFEGNPSAALEAVSLAINRSAPDAIELVDRLAPSALDCDTLRSDEKLRDLEGEENE